MSLQSFNNRYNIRKDNTTNLKSKIKQTTHFTPVLFAFMKILLLNICHRSKTFK